MKVLHLNNSTIKHFKQCFNINGSPKKSENIRWQFLNNPESNCFVDIAYDVEEEKTAGIYAVSCVKFKIRNAIEIGTQSLDTITDINYRGKGLFIKLAKNVYSNAKNDGMALVYGFPNGNSIHGFEKKLEWKVLDPLPFLIKPLKLKYFTDKIKFLNFLPNVNLSFFKFKESNHYLIKEDNSFPIEVDNIWRNFSKNINVAVIRDKAYLDWRYVQKPNEDYRIIHCYDMNKQYIGFLVYTIKEKHGGKIAYIMELIYDLENPKAGKLLLNYAINSVKQHGADCILAWCFKHSPNFNHFKRQFFFKMPEKLKPIELHFGVHAFKNNLAETVNKQENWYISYSDSDTV